MSVERILTSLIIGIFQTFAVVFIISRQLGKIDFTKKIIFFCDNVRVCDSVVLFYFKSV